MRGEWSNEELAERIQNGEKDLMPLLWGRCRKTIYKIVLRHRYLIAERADVGIEDLEQCGFLAMAAAVKQYDGTKPYKFVTYIEYKFKTEVFSLLGARYAGGKYNFPILARPISEAVGDNDENGLEELLEDENAGRFTEDYEKKEMQRIVREAVEKLPELERYVIQEIFFKRKNIKEVVIEGEKSRYAESVQRKALNRLRKDETLQALQVAWFGNEPNVRKIHTTPEKTVIQEENWDNWFKKMTDDVRRLENGF